MARSDKDSCFKSGSVSIPQSCSPRSSLLRSTDYETKKRGLDEKSEAREEVVAEVQVKQVNRCFGCRKRVGLTGFQCRCGELFCGEHRYSDRHDCGFDYRAAGRAAIALQNPTVKAEKLAKI